MGDRVRALRKAKNMSMEKLAEHAGIDYRQVFNIEHGKTNATVSTLHNISKALDISISELFDIDSLK
nr:helix-turn-helix transcriptional regulator [Pedobacter sp. MC2016-24]